MSGYSSAAWAGSSNFPVLVLALYWSRLTTGGALASMLVGIIGTIALIVLSPAIQVDLFKHATAPFPLRNPALVTVPLAFAAAVVVSLLGSRRAAPQERFMEVQQRLHV